MRRFVEENKKSILWSLLFSFLCFGFMLTHFALTIDEESWILASKDVNIWLYQGRYVIWLFDLLFTKGGNYAPFLWDVMGIVLWHLSGVIFAYCFFGKTKIESWLLLVFLSYYSSVPFVLADVMSFSMYVPQIGLAAVAAAAAFYYTKRYVERGDWKIAAGVFALLVYSFGTYQAFICVYVTAVAAEALLNYVREDRRAIKKTIIAGAAICFAGVCTYYLINFAVGKAIGTAGYLTDNYMGWTGGNPLKEAAMAVANIGRVSFAIPYQGVYVNGGASIRTVTILFVIYAVWKFLTRKGVKEKIGVCFFTVALCFAPFSLYLAIATYKTQGRMMLALPLMGAVQLYLIFREIGSRKIRYLMLALTGYLLFVNARDMNVFYYYASITYEKDCTTADQIMLEVQKEGIDYQSKPLAFVGMVEQKEDPQRELGVLGGSMFAWDEGNNSRMIDFIQTRGYAVEMAGPEQIKKALQESADMVAWPREGCVRELEDVIVIYLSEPTEKWYSTNNVSP